MLYLTDDVAELTVKERQVNVRRMVERRPTHKAHLGDTAMIWIASGIAAAFALVLWL
jgi:hypothetical protein